MASSTVWPGGSSMTTVLGAGEMAGDVGRLDGESGLATLDLGGPRFIADDDHALGMALGESPPGVVRLSGHRGHRRRHGQHGDDPEEQGRTCRDGQESESQRQKPTAMYQFRFRGMPIEG